MHQKLSSYPSRTLTYLRDPTRRCSRSFRPCASPLVIAPTKTAAEMSSFFPDSDDPIIPVPSLPSCGDSYPGSRNHNRGGSIMLSHAPSVKRTPPTSPLPLPAPTSTLPQPQPHACFDSSTPSITSSSSSRSPVRAQCHLRCICL